MRLLRSACIAALVLLCTALPTFAVTRVDPTIAEPIYVATEPEEIDEKVYYYQDEQKIPPEDFPWVEGRHGLAVRLNGENQYLRYSAERTLQLEEFTFSAWVKLQGDDGNVGQKLLTVYKNESMFITMAPHLLDAERAIDGLYMEWQDREIEPVVLHSDPEADTTFALEGNAWHHVAIVVSDTEFSLYVDGFRFYSEEMDTSFVEMELNTFLVGGGFYGEPLLNALLDDAYLYPQALEASHIQLLAADMDPADGGKAPTAGTIYRPTEPSSAPTAAPKNDAEAGLSPLVIILPVAFIIGIILLSVVFSRQKKVSAPTDSDGDAANVIGEPELPTDPEEENDGEPVAMLTEEEIQAAEEDEQE